MKRIFLFLFTIFLAVSCTETQPKEYHSDWTRNSVVYEMNVRQLTPEGTFAAAAGQLPRLKELGVDIVWLMPIHPIGVVERKGTLGSYYSPKDYLDVNPDYGTIADFDAFLGTAHSLGLKVILDWVANHTSPDSKWAEEHPDWFLHDENGAFVVQHDWTDIAPMDLSNEEMKEEMRHCMRFWLDRGVDGFRCDVAGEMPVEYWQDVLVPIREEYENRYFLAEGEKPELHTAGFDATYAWKLHHMLNDIAQGNAGIAELVDYINTDMKEYPEDAYRLAFTSNHDENSWAGTEYERMGDAWQAMTVLCWTLPNTQPLIYTGQEIGMNHRFAFFEKDTMPQGKDNHTTDFYRYLANLKHTHPALNPDGKGSFELLSSDDNTLVFKRTSGDDAVTVSVRLEAPWNWEIKTDESRIEHIEPLSWWVGMKTPLQLMVKADGIGEYTASFEEKSLTVTDIHKADSPNYLFIDVKVAADAAPGTYHLVLYKGDDKIRVPYQISERREESAERVGFGPADLIYLIMPDRFANGDPDNDNTDDTADKADRNLLPGRHGGDFQGIRDHLDYLEELGVTAIWNTPVQLDAEPESSYHGYACGDYYRMDPRFGSNRQYRSLVGECHSRGIKMIMDFVSNHCGSAHWWMSDLPFQDWIHQWPEYTHSNCAFSMQNDPNASDYDRQNMVGGWFDTSMPDMNMDNDFLLKYFTQAAIWWIEWADIDGIRVDTYPYNDKEPMARWCEAIRTEYPSFNIVGEVYTSHVAQLAYWQDGAMNPDGFDSNLPSIMDFPLHSALCQGVPCDKVNWDEGLTRVYDALSNDEFYADPTNIMVFCSNHDTDRVGDVVGRNPDRQKMILAIVGTVRGYPQIFSGDEQMFISQGGWHRDGALRVDFPGGWDGDVFDLFTAEGREKCDIDFDGSHLPAGTRAEVFDFASRLFQWRKTSDAVINGHFKHFLTRDNTYAYFRYSDSDKVFVYLNNSSEDKRIPWENYSEITDGLGSGTDVISGQTVDPSNYVVPAHGLLIIDF